MTSKINLKNGEVHVDVILFQEDVHHIAYVPALNLTSHSKVKENALENLKDSIQLFFDYWGQKGELDNKLIKLGWTQEMKNKKKRMIPSNENFSIPYSVLSKNLKKTNIAIPAY